MTLWDLLAHRKVDLTRSFAPGIPKFSSDPDEVRHHFSIRGQQFSQYQLIGQWGTHVDAPAHFVSGGRRLAEIPVSEMILPLVVLDFSAEVAKNPNFVLTDDHIKWWEDCHCRIPVGAFVAFRSDWPATTAVASPGWSVAAIDFLVCERNITAIGHETLDTDPGQLVAAGQMPAQLRILQLDRWQIERMTNLAQVPEIGAMLIASWPKPTDASGFPARAIAVLPLVR